MPSLRRHNTPASWADGPPRPPHRRRRFPALLALFTVVALLPGGFTATAARAATACSATYTLVNSWAGGFQGGIHLTNLGDPVSSWSLTWTYPDGQQLTQSWNGVYSQSGSAVTINNASWNGGLATGASVDPGFLGTWTGANSAPPDLAMNGVRCTGPNVPPSVSLPSPAPGSSSTVGTPVQLAATASDSDGTVAKVEFYNGTTLLATDTTSPYSATFTPTAAGSYSLTAKAYDDKGASATSAPVGITVTPGAAVVASPATVNVGAGSSATFTVALSQAPSGNVTITTARTSGSTDVSVSSGSSLVFTPANWNAPQQVGVTAATGATGDATLTSVAAGYASATVTAHVLAGTSPYDQRFLTMYQKLHDPANGYFSATGVPYHSIETLMVEAPDYGHETTSEAFSYWTWIEAEYGRITGDWTGYNNAWATAEKYIIPSHADQPTNSFYNASKPATYAGESDNQADYPQPLDFNVSVGQDPLAGELTSTYGSSDIYGMHWLLDVDNTYGFGHCGDGTTAPAYINTFQRGSSESVWETVPQPSCDTFTFGGKNGYLDLFVKDSSYAKQWKYTDAPDADARAVQAAYWALQWATRQGKQSQVSTSVAKAVKMGDFLRYAMFDKYFKKIGNCVGPSTCPAGTGKDSDHYLMSWYYAWGGALDTNAGWAWRIGDGAAHQGYQNPMAAYALSSVADMKPLSATGAADWGKSLSRQLELYQWLQSSEGGIAGGATNSWAGSYATPPAGTPTFYGMYYDPQPVWHDPPSNRWFGFQAWSMERVAEYYYVTGDAKAKAVLDKWVAWAAANTKVNADNSFSIPSDLTWSGTPDTWNPTSPGTNAGLHVSVSSTTQDVGVAGSLAKVLTYYGAKANNASAKTLAKQLLDAMWAADQDPQGVSLPETRTDYSRFNDPVYVPPGWTGKMPNGDAINSSSTFLSLRSWYKNDPNWSKVQSYLNGGSAPTFRFHRFWAQADVATAMAVYAELIG